MKQRKIYFVALLMLLAVCTPHGVKAKDEKVVHVKCGQETTIKLANKKDKIKWSSTSKKIKIVRKYGKNNNKVKIKGIKEGTATLKAVFNKKVVKYKIKVANGEETVNTAKCTVTLNNIDVQENCMKVYVSITDISGTGIRIGAHADFYQWDEVSSSWVLAENTAPVPAAMYGAPKGTEMIQEYVYMPVTGNSIGGKYKIVLDNIYALDRNEIILARPEIEFSI